MENLANKYSPISKIFLMNFRNIGEATISFEKSPIICLQGDNEAGKTSVVKAFSVLALHYNQREQKNYVRTGTNFFGVAVQLKDGTLIKRQKTSDLNMYSVQYPDGKIWEISKVAEGLPVEVQRVMGLIEEPETKEYLHVRTYEDLLLFAVTPYSTNYKVMYNALKVEQLTNAIKLASKDINSYKNEISKAEDGIDAIDANKKNIHIVDTSQLLNIKSRLESQISTLDKLEKAEKILNIIEQKEKQLGLIKLLDMYDVKEVNIPLIMRLETSRKSLQTIEMLESNINKFKDLETLQDVNILTTEKLLRANIINNRLEELKRKEGILTDIEKLETVNELLASKINTAIKSEKAIKTLEKEFEKVNINELSLIEQSDIESITKINKLINIIEANKEKESKYTECIKYVNNMTEYLKKCGVAFEVCQNCGSDVIIDLDKLGGNSSEI